MQATGKWLDSALSRLHRCVRFRQTVYLPGASGLRVFLKPHHQTCEAFHARRSPGFLTAADGTCTEPLGRVHLAESTGCGHARQRIESFPVEHTLRLTQRAAASALTSRSTVTLISPGNVISSSIRLAMSFAIANVASSSADAASTMTRTSRPA